MSGSCVSSSEQHSRGIDFPGPGFWVQAARHRIQVSFRIQGFVQGSGFWFRVQGFGFRL